MRKNWRRLPKVLSQGEAKQLMETVLPGPDTPYRQALRLRNRAILELLYGSGLRVGELIGLQPLDLKWKERSLLVCGKGGKERLVPVGIPALTALRAYLDEGRPFFKKNGSSFLFISSQSRKLTKNHLWNIVSAYARRVGSLPHVHPHTLRHCFATHMLENGADLQTIQDLLGHAFIDTTEIYMHVNPPHLRAACKRHPRDKTEKRFTVLQPGPKVCSQCRNACEPGHTFCATHLLKNREAVRRSRDKKKAGL
jgi:integrase/recombinase XerD